ncbi:hypothetical protein [Nostoc sp. MG11]|uniref:hypothetical protein n=1 Tax=Nostoc sp. MG11 TaxID=2721166 RepID=UPI001867FBEE|nr:hypothetical protein [Nostoc sp. MG11]
MFSFNQFLNLLRRTLLTGLLAGLIWLPGLPFNSAIAMPNSLASTATPAKGDERLIALISCLPKQLSQPSFKRAWDEMGNDQLERAFNLKTNPKLSQAEIELNNCMKRQGFTSQSELQNS